MNVSRRKFFVFAGTAIVAPFLLKDVEVHPSKISSSIGEITNKFYQRHDLLGAPWQIETSAVVNGNSWHVADLVDEEPTDDVLEKFANIAKQVLLKKAA